jgi:hypothetical protein
MKTKIEVAANIIVILFAVIVESVSSMQGQLTL